MPQAGDVDGVGRAMKLHERFREPQGRSLMQDFSQIKREIILTYIYIIYVYVYIHIQKQIYVSVHTCK